MSDRKTYHHGNLRQALIDAALALIGEKGAAGVSFAEAARRAGVSPAAPYRHFRDRDELLAETARQGFALFADRLEAAWNGGRPNPLRALEALGRAYIAFARAEPAYFAAMFETGGTQAPTQAAQVEGSRAFGALRMACAALAERLPPARRPPVDMMAYHLWAMAHGAATLFARPGARSPIEAEDLLEASMAVYLRGLGLLPPDVAASA